MDSNLILAAARGTLDGTVRAGLATGSSASVAVCKDRRAWNIITWITSDCQTVLKGGGRDDGHRGRFLRGKRVTYRSQPHPSQCPPCQVMKARIHASAPM